MQKRRCMPHISPSELQCNRQQKNHKQSTRKPCTLSQIVQIQTAKERRAATSKHKGCNGAPPKDAAHSQPDADPKQHGQHNQAYHTPLPFRAKARCIGHSYFLRIAHAANGAIRCLLLRHPFSRICSRLILNMVSKFFADDAMRMFPVYLCAYYIKVFFFFIKLTQFRLPLSARGLPPQQTHPTPPPFVQASHAPLL